MSKRVTIAFRTAGATLVYPIAGDEVYERQLRTATQVRIRLETDAHHFEEIVLDVGAITIVRGESAADPAADTVPGAPLPPALDELDDDALVLEPDDGEKGSR